MEDIKIGEYVRNEDGYIEKISSFDKLTNIYKDEEGILRKWEGEDVFGNEYSTIILKHSPNIIDLIEVGDYVNGLKVDKKYEDRVVINTRDKIIVWFEYQIKSIVTKEQFENIKYKIGE